MDKESYIGIIRLIGDTKYISQYFLRSGLNIQLSKSQFEMSQVGLDNKDKIKY